MHVDERLDFVYLTSKHSSSTHPKLTLQITDMHTDFGGPLNVRKLVGQYIRAGVAGFHLEDQVQTKRCGHLGGKEVVDRETCLIRIRAAVAAGAEYRSDIFIIGRADALQKHTHL